MEQKGTELGQSPTMVVVKVPIPIDLYKRLKSLTEAQGLKYTPFLSRLMAVGLETMADKMEADSKAVATQP